MEAKLRFTGETEVAAHVLVDLEESDGVLQDTLAADCLATNSILLGEHSPEDTNGVPSESRAESSVKSISNMGCMDGKGDPSEEESEGPGLV